MVLYVYMWQSLLQASFSSYLLFPTYLLCHDYSEVHIHSHRGATISVTLVKSDKGRAPIIVLLINNEYFLDQEREHHQRINNKFKSRGANKKTPWSVFMYFLNIFQKRGTFLFCTGKPFCSHILYWARFRKHIYLEPNVLSQYTFTISVLHIYIHCKSRAFKNQYEKH